MRFLATCSAGLGLFTGANGVPAQALLPTSPVRQAVDMQVPHVPAALRTGGARQLVYELHLTNFASKALDLSRVQVLDGATSDVVLDLASAPLAAATALPGAPDAEKQVLSIAQGRRMIVYLSVPIGDSPPESLTHRIELSTHGPTAAPVVVSGGDVRIARSRPPILGAPLRGGPWAAVYDPDMERGHRRMVYAVEGRARIPGRHAVDWMVAGSSGRSGTGNKWAATDGFGAEVLAVSDGVVAATRDGVAEPVKGVKRPPTNLADATGNYIALDIGEGRYAFYEHLAPGLSVKPGQRVRRGEVIARLGSTGQANRPHLHFHLSDVNAPLAAEGQPFELTGWRAVGAYSSIDAFKRGEPWIASTGFGTQVANDGFPAPNAVVVFD